MSFEHGGHLFVTGEFAAFGCFKSLFDRSALVIAELVDPEMACLDFDNVPQQLLLRLLRPGGDTIEQCFEAFVHGPMILDASGVGIRHHRSVSFNSMRRLRPKTSSGRSGSHRSELPEPAAA